MNKIKLICALGMVTLAVFGCNSTADGVKSATDNNVSAVANEAADADGEGNTDEEQSVEKNTTENEEALKESDANKDIPILRDTLKNEIDSRIGCATTLSEIKDEKVFDIITTYFDSVTIGNELKPDAMFGYSNGKCPGVEEVDLDGEMFLAPKMDFSRAEEMLDMLYDWNKEHPDREVKVRGHVLVWHSQTPEWFFHEDYDKKKDYVDAETMNKRLRWYIKTMLTHFTGEDSKYKDMFYGWDVVNEAISDGTGTYRTDSENSSEKLSNDTHGSNSSWWHVYGSNEYIINAFKYANEFAPADLELYYNDYNECTLVKRNGIIELLKAVKAEEGEPGVGTRITAFGMQGHYDMSNPDFNAVEASIKMYGEVVGDVQITEMDLKASKDYDGSEESKEKEYEDQRKRYNMIYFSIKAADKTEGVHVSGITFWGTVDQYSWLQSRSDVGGGNTSGLACCPLLFDENYEPKPCYFVFAGEK